RSKRHDEPQTEKRRLRNKAEDHQDAVGVRAQPGRERASSLGAVRKWLLRYLLTVGCQTITLASAGAPAQRLHLGQPFAPTLGADTLDVAVDRRANRAHADEGQDIAPQHLQGMGAEPPA